MRKRIGAALLILALSAGAALAERCEGTLVADALVNLCAASGGRLEYLSVEAGQRVSAGEVVGECSADLLFAAQNGTVAAISAGAGDEVQGELIALAPENAYLIYCSTDGAYQSVEDTLVHAGETLYVKCKRDGTHRGIGVAHQIDGAEYRVTVIGGEFYAGEAVYLYRDAEFSASQRVGIGTVLAAEAQSYEIDGSVVEICVEEGEKVERGELLARCASSDDTRIVSEVDGIVAQILAQPGDALEAGQAVLSLALPEAIRIEVSVDEKIAATIAPGARVSYIRACDGEEGMRYGRVLSVSALAQDGQYRVRIQPDVQEEWIGMHVEVLFE